ncbi:MAG TPA: zf-HC2 domain-containing protein [Streptosporangiaceae bacterium]
MSGTAECREIRHALGVYVLGAIDPADRALVDEHLATCSECREELAGLAGLPALLRRVPTAEAERLAVADQPDESVLDAAAEELLPSALARTAQIRRVRRWRELAAAAAVAVLALGAGAAGAHLLGSGAPAAKPPLAGQVLHWHSVAHTDAVTQAGLAVKYARKPWGTTMLAQVWGIPPGTVCQFVVIDTQGHRWVLGGWRVNYTGEAPWYPLSTSLTDSQLRTFEVTAAGRVLVSAHPA